MIQVTATYNCDFCPATEKVDAGPWHNGHSFPEPFSPLPDGWNRFGETQVICNRHVVVQGPTGIQTWTVPDGYELGLVLKEQVVS